jgi:hypothetical protein
MQRSTLVALLDVLAIRAEELGITRTEWARRAGLPKETLSRLQHRSDCNFETLRALAGAVHMDIDLVDGLMPDLSSDGHFPSAVMRDYEERLVELCASGDLHRHRWSSCGPRFFMAGLAVMMASDRNSNRRGLLDLAEELHPGASLVETFNRWLERAPVRPSRFFPMVEARRAFMARDHRHPRRSRAPHAS